MRFPTPPRKSYPSDLTDKQWSFLELLLPPERTDGLGDTARGSICER